MPKKEDIFASMPLISPPKEFEEKALIKDGNVYNEGKDIENDFNDFVHVLENTTGI